MATADNSERLTLQVDPDDSGDEVTYWTIVWAQFKTNRIAWWGSWAILGLVMMAIFAPALCLERPFFMAYDDPTSGERIWAWPWFTSLLGDRNLFENSVDVFFNLLMVVSPAVALTGWGLAQRIKKRRRRARTSAWQRFVAIWLVIVTVGMVGLSIWPSSQPYKDYNGMISGTEAQAEALVIAYKRQIFASGGTIDQAQVDRLRSGIPFAVFPPIQQSFRDTSPERARLGMSSVHLFGTDNVGRDVFARMLYGTRIALTIGVVAVSIYILIGIVLGALAGFFGGWVDTVILRIIEIMICFPVLILIMTLVAFVEQPTIFHVMLIIGLTRWTGTARLTRGEFLKLKNQDFVQAAIASGIPRHRVIFRHVLPNALSPVLVTASFGVASAILIEATLSFLGLGDASAPSWGELIKIGKDSDTMRLIMLPGMAIFITVSLFNLVGEGLQDALDPKRRR